MPGNQFSIAALCVVTESRMDFVLSAWDLEAGLPIFAGIVLWESWAMEVGVERTQDGVGVERTQDGVIGLFANTGMPT